MVVLQEPHHTLAVERLAAPRQLVSAAGRAPAGAVKACDRAATVGEAVVAADAAQGDVREIPCDQQPGARAPEASERSDVARLDEARVQLRARVMALAGGALSAERQASATSATMVTAKNAARLVIACSRAYRWPDNIRC